MSYQVRRYRIPDRSYEDDREVDVKITRKTSDREENYRGREERETSRRETRVVRERIVERSPSPEPYREVRVQREVVRERERERERPQPEYLERYVRETEYLRDNDRVQPIYISQPAPQPIIIREQAPQQIVIRERQREEQSYEMERHERQDRNDDARSVAASYRSGANRSRRQSSPSDQEEDYVYKRRTRQIARRPDQEYEAQYRRDVDPRDSVSNWGGPAAAAGAVGAVALNRNDNRRYNENRRYDDEEDGYYRRRTTEEYYSDDGGGGGGSSRDHSPHHKRHIAEGAALGLGAAALLRRNNNKLGKDAGSAKRLAGGAALGAVGAEVLSRAHEHYAREKSRGRDRRGGSRGRSRSASPGPFSGGLTKLAGVAVLGALAGYAATRGKDGGALGKLTGRNNSKSRGSSRSRSPGSDSDDPEIAKDKQKATIAKAGLASAAIAGLVDRARSKSRPGQSRSKVRALGPIVGAGLGGAALAGLYEQQKDQKKATKTGSTRGRSPRRSRSRRRDIDPAPAGGAVFGPHDQNLISYGGEPIPPPSGGQPRARSRANSYYSDRGDRQRGGSASSANSDSPRRRRNRSRNRRRAENETRDQQPISAFGPYAQEPPPPQAPSPNPGAQYQPNHQQPPSNQYYPPGNNFQPPPQNMYQSPVDDGSHNGGDFPPHDQGQGQGQGVTQATHSQWFPPPDGRPQPTNYPGGYEPARQGYNVSNPPPRDLGMSTSSTAADRYIPQKRRSVSFAEAPSIHEIPAQPHTQQGERHNAGDIDGSDDHDLERGEGQRNTQGTTLPRSVAKAKRQESSANKTTSRRPRPARSQSVDSDAAGPSRPRNTAATEERDRPSRKTRPRASSVDNSVEELPPRFDKEGRRIASRGEDPLADGVEDLLKGKVGEMLMEMFSRLGGQAESRQARRR